MTFRFTKLLFVGVVLFAGVSGRSQAQQESWQKVAPVGESFTVLMPTRAIEATRRIPLNDSSWVPAREYLSLAGGKRYLVVSFRRTTPERTPALSSFDSFLLAIEQTFKGDDKTIAKSLMFDHDVSIERGVCKQYRVRVAEYQGIARFVWTEKAIYVLMVIGADERAAEVQRFFESFTIGESNTDAALNGIAVLTIGSGQTAPEQSAPVWPPDPWPRDSSPISGGVLNGKAVFFAVPEYPSGSRESGQVMVQILIDEQGTVISAKAVEGPESLREAAVNAASKSRFTPTRLSGQPVKVIGIVVYNFVPR